MSESIKPTIELIPVEIEFEHPFARVLNDHLVVAIDKFHYSGRLIVPDSAKRMPTKGRVVAIADNIKDVQIGDRVLYSQFAGYALVFEGLPVMRVIGYNELLAVLKPQTPDLIGESAS